MAANDGKNLYGDISQRVGIYAVKKFLKRAKKECIVDKFAQFTPIPKNHSQTLKFRRYKTLGRITTPLTEGVTPTGQELVVEDVTASLAQYGGVVQFSDQILDTHEDPVLNETVGLMGEQAAESFEAIKIAILNNCTNQFFAGGTTKATVSAAISLGLLRLVNRALRRNLAAKITNIVNAGPNISTEAVGASYILMGHTDLETDFRNITGFLPVERYGDAYKAVSEYEIGKVENFRIILTSMFEPEKQAGASGTTLLSNGAPVSSAAAADVYPVFAIGRDAYAFTPLGGQNAAHVVVVNPKPTDSDPLAQKGHVGWKGWMGGAILNDLWMAKINVGCTGTY
ncbi:MAG: N4-gp56 family major capsid protein [Lentisphaeria bacterium]|nr:N4-gp56 family major capsid protein [Lentisphaeria bacterium]